MAEGKKSFVLYTDIKHTVDHLTIDQAGKLFKHLLAYVNDENPEFEKEDLLLRVAFEPIKRQLKRDLKDWEETRQKRSNAGHLGGVKSAESRKTKQNEANEANASRLKQSQANEAVNVTVNVNDTVNENVTNKEDKSSLPTGGIKKHFPDIGNKKTKKKVPPKKKGKNPDSEPYWKAIRFKWIWFNKTHLRFNVEPIPTRDYSHMHRIIEKLRERAVGQAIEWTEKNALERWENFLTIAYTKDDWLHKHFLLGNLEGKMQQVFNLIENPNGQSRQKSSGSTTGSVGKTIEFDRP